MESSSTSSIEVTLEDTLEYLREEKRKRENEVKKLMNIIKNNEVRTIRMDVTPDDIRRKRLKFVQAVEAFVSNEQPKDLPVPDTPDFYINVLRTIEEEVHNMEELNELTDKEIADLESDITYMERKKAAFQQMKEASHTAAESETTDFEAEMVVTKHVFQDAKKDLGTVVSTLFPENDHFQEFLLILCRALAKGGDDLYVDVDPEYITYALFLEEANIAQFHPNDKSKVKLLNL